MMAERTDWIEFTVDVGRWHPEVIRHDMERDAAEAGLLIHIEPDDGWFGTPVRGRVAGPEYAARLFVDAWQDFGIGWGRK